MKKVLIFILGGLLIASGLANADHGHKHAKGKGDGPICEGSKMESLTQELHLTQEQQAKVKSAFDKKLKQKRELHDKTHAKMKKIHQKHRDTMNSILDGEQRKKYAEMTKADQDAEHCDKCCEQKDCPHKH